MSFGGIIIMASATSVIVLSPMSALAKVKMNVRTEVDLSLPQVHTYVYTYDKETGGC